MKKKQGIERIGNVSRLIPRHLCLDPPITYQKNHLQKSERSLAKCIVTQHKKYLLKCYLTLNDK